jgi:hypothetical protein
MKRLDLPAHLVPDPRLSEQFHYALLLERWTLVGQVLLAAAFAAYLLGMLPPHVAFDRLPQLWMQPLQRFVELSASPTGWQWLVLPTRGEATNLLGIAVLSSGPSLCLLGLVRSYLRHGDRAQAVFCLAIAALLLFAAAGLPPHRS